MKDIFTTQFNIALQMAKITQAELAVKMNISKQCISDYKSGKSFPSIQNLRLLAMYLDVSTDFLLGLKEL